MLSLFFISLAPPRSSVFASSVRNRYRRRIPSRRTFGISCSTRVHIGSMVHRAKRNAKVPSIDALPFEYVGLECLFLHKANVKHDVESTKLVATIIQSGNIDSFLSALFLHHLLNNFSTFFYISFLHLLLIWQGDNQIALSSIQSLINNNWIVRIS